MDDFFHSSHLDTLLYIDAGVESAKLAGDRWARKKLSKDELSSINRSGFGGQIVCGLKYDGVVVLEPVAQVFSNIWEDEHAHFPGEGCGNLILEAPQRCATNKFAAQLANNVINNLFHTDSLYTHVINFNAQTGYSGGSGTFISDADLKLFSTLNSIGELDEDL
jgi:hypothetical protein